MASQYSTVYKHQVGQIWTENNLDAFYGRIYENAGSSQGANQRISDKFLYNASYLRVKNITLSYTIPDKYIKSVYLRNLKIFISGENLFTFDHLPAGIDPENLSWTYPFSRTISFGINLIFDWIMKKNIIYIWFILSFSMGGCNDDFLEYLPKTDLTEETAFVTYDNFKTYSWGLYNIFQNTNMRQYINPSAVTNTMLLGDVYANYLYNSNSSDTQSNNWQWNNITSSMNTDDSWNFDYIRRVNIMLRNIESSEMSEEDKAHWRSVGLFFRSYRYYDLLARYGDVPWLENVVNDDDEAILYGERTPRDEVAQNLLRDLKYAEENIKTRRRRN